MKTEKDLDELVIDRKKWGTGRLIRDAREFGDGDPDNGKMCCLGFYCLAAGVELGKTRYSSGYPYSLEESDREKLPIWMVLLGVEKDWQKLADVNDDKEMAQDSKEQSIIDIFAKHGTKVTFVD